MNVDGRRSELVDKVRNFLDEDRNMSPNTVSMKFAVCVATAHTIIHEDLNKCKIFEKSVPEMLSDERKKNALVTVGLMCQNCS